MTAKKKTAARKKVGTKKPAARKASSTGPACSSCGTAQDPADTARCADCGSTMFTDPNAETVKDDPNA